MSDEPSNGELARQLADIKTMLAGFIGQREYEEIRRALDWRFGQIERDLADERRERGEDMKTVHARITAVQKARVSARDHWRTLLWTGALPAAVALIGIAITLVIAYHGGSTHG